LCLFLVAFSPTRRHRDYMCPLQGACRMLDKKQHAKIRAFSSIPTWLNVGVAQTHMQTANDRTKIVCMLHPMSAVFGRSTGILAHIPPPLGAARSQLKTYQMPGERPLVTQLVADAGLLTPASLICWALRNNERNATTHPLFPLFSLWTILNSTPKLRFWDPLCPKLVWME
jgi:hypothetical protein